MYDELVKRLREHNGWALNETLDEAADAIEELSKDLERSKEWEAFWEEEANEALKKFQTAVASKPRWTSVTEALPESGGSYIVYLRPFKGKTDLGYAIGDLAYPTEMYFDKGQMLWVGENESYNAILSAVDTENEYHVTHWMPLPEPPKEERA